MNPAEAKSQSELPVPGEVVRIPEEVIVPIPEEVVVDPAQKFRDDLVRVSSNPFRLPLQFFMAKSDEYPRFVWQNFLLSFQACLRGSQGGQDGDQEKFGPYGLQKFSHIIDFYPDILQRELLRDSFELALQGPKKLRYGALHAAVLCDKEDLVYLMRDPDKYRDKIIKRLTADEPTGDVWGSFMFIRRAVLWKHMRTDRDSYAGVATFLQDLDEVRNLSKLEGLRRFIEESTAKIDLEDEFHPWITILAWSAVSRRSKHIIEEFKRCKPELFEKILRSLEKQESPFLSFFSDSEGQQVDSPRRQVQQPTVQSIIKLLVLEVEEEDVEGSENGNLVDRRYNFMQKYFLDRLSERTPKSRWSPLHFAAAYGKIDMVRLLIRSCNTILDKLGKEVKTVYVSNIQTSFHDAKYMTPLHYAVLGNHRAIVEALMGWKTFQPHVNDRDIFMRTAFQIACCKAERKDVAEQLVIDRLLDINTEDCCSFTGVHWAVYGGCTDTARVLILHNDSFAYKEGLIPLIKALQMKTSQKLLLNLASMKNEMERLYRDRQVYVDAANAILVGAALIASVTFGGWLQAPLGLNQDLKYREVEIQLFWAFNSLSFFFSIGTVMAGAAAVLPVRGFDNNMEKSVEGIRRWLAVTSSLLIISVTFVLGAFAAAGFSSLSLVNTTNLIVNMAITTCVGVSICAIVGCLFCLRLWGLRPLWVNEVLQAMRDSIKGEELLKTGNSIIHRLRGFPSRMIDFCSGFRLTCVSLSSKWSAFFQPCQEAKGNGNSVHQDSIHFGPQKPEQLTLILDSVLNMAGSGSEPYAVHHKKIEKTWKQMHPRREPKSCPIRDCYEGLEKVCCDEILNFSIGTEEFLKEYVAMWRDLSQQPLKDTPKAKQHVKQIVENLQQKYRHRNGQRSVGRPTNGR